MQGLKIIRCFLFLNICIQFVHAQSKQSLVTSSDHLLFGSTQFVQTDSGLIINEFYLDHCKNHLVKTKFIPNNIIAPLVQFKKVADFPKPKLITLHGNISYDFFYRSKIDTPYIQQNMQQHNERVWLDIMIKGKYPFKVGFSARQSNSPFYRDLFNMNVNFDKYGFVKNMKQHLIDRLNTVKWQNPDLKIIDSLLKEKTSRYQNLVSHENAPEELQKIIEDREQGYKGKQKMRDISIGNQLPALPVYQKIKLKNGRSFILKTDSLTKAKSGSISSQIDSTAIEGKESYALIEDSFYIKKLKNRKTELDSLQKSITLLNHQSDSLKRMINQSIIKIKQAIYKAVDPKELDKIAKDNKIEQPKHEGVEKFLTNIKSLNIGRSMIDYTPLTAQNIMLTGINIEYNPTYYVALATGKFDYGFRDMLGRGIKQTNTYLTLGRIGWGNKDKRAVILTVFNGRKNNYAGLISTDNNKNTAQLFGYSIETIFKKNEYNFFSAEIAKSTKSNGPSPQVIGEKPNNLFRFNDNTNMGINIKGQTQIIGTDTKLSGFFRKTGEAFQSFSLFTYNTNQQSWQARIDQSFLKRKINVTAMLRQNDFTNPVTDKTFKTSTVFKSLQVNVRVPHWPTINAGYFPGTQFYIIDNNTIKENAYYILNGAVLHSYSFKDILMNSSFIYNRYFNKASDSGFVLYKGINYILSQTMAIKKLQFEISYSLNKQSELSYYTLDANGDYSIKQHFRLGGGLKFNKVFGIKKYWGESIRLGVDFKKFGGLQLHYEKSYLPTLQQTLAPVEIGRVSWYKIF
jgi:hypothetical protein